MKLVPSIKELKIMKGVTHINVFCKQIYYINRLNEKN